jgi:hypothetical protein
MTQSKSKTVIATQGILYTIADYCERNPHVKLWAEKRGLVYELFIGSESEFSSEPNQYTPAEIFEIKKENIFTKCNEIDILTKNRFGTKICASNLSKNFTKEYNEIYAEVFWNNEPHITSGFAEAYINPYLNFGKLLKYKRYPDVFSDLDGKDEKVHRNWNKLLATIPIQQYIYAWKNLKNITEFHETLTEFKSSHPQIKPHLFLTNALKVLMANTEITNDAKLQTSYMLAELLPKNSIKKYIDDFPLLESLTNKKDKESFFKQKDEEIIEKLVLKQEEIYQFFQRDYLTANEYLQITKKTLNFINENNKLKENGLVSTDLFMDETINFYMTLSRNDIINKNFIKELFLDTMNSFIDNPELIEEGKGSIKNALGSLKVFNDDLLSLLLNKNIDRLILEKELENKPLETKAIKRKI